MCIKFSDKQLKVISDFISECLFCKIFLGGKGGGPLPPDLLEKAYASHCAGVLHTPGCNTSAL